MQNLAISTKNDQPSASAAFPKSKGKFAFWLLLFPYKHKPIYSIIAVRAQTRISSNKSSLRTESNFEPEKRLLAYLTHIAENVN